ncbi:MAG: glycosyltransferase family 4 protein [Planctomycetaceae bacterium]
MKTDVMTSGASLLVVCHAWYGDVIGGSFRLASEFAEDLAAAGYDLHYVCCAPDDPADRPECEQINGVTIDRYPPPAAGAGPMSRMRHHIGRTRAIVARICEQHRVAAVSGHSPLQFLGAARGVPRGSAFLNYTVHSPFDDEVAANARGAGILSKLTRWPAVRAARWIDRRNCTLADRVQCDSQYTLDTLQRKYPREVDQKGCVAPGWVDYDRFSAAGDRALARRALGKEWQSDLPVFFTLRRLEARMGLDTLIAAAAVVRDRGHGFRVLIGGGGSLRPTLEQQVRDCRLTEQVQFLGRVPEAHLATCYAAADCFVLPTRALECFGLIVLESFAAGTPVIASRAAAIPEIAGRQGPGWDFEPGNVPELADRLTAYLEGRLLPTVDLRGIAREYDRPRVFERWQRLLVGDGSADRDHARSTRAVAMSPVVQNL